MTETPTDPPHAESTVSPVAGSVRFGRLRWLVGQRIVHFVLLGVLLYGIMPKQEDPRTLSLGEEEIRAIWALHARRQGGGELSAAQKEDVLVRHIEDEILHREGVRLGMDRDDGIVRARVIQKMMFYAEDVAGASSPSTDAHLRAYFDAHPEQFRRPPEYRFQQVFVSLAGRPHDAESFAGTLRDRLLAEPNLDPETLGAKLPAARLKEWNRPTDVRAALGDAVADVLEGLPLGAWSAPVRSPYGFHILRVNEKRPGGLREFSEARKDVLVAYQAERKSKALADLYARLLREYEVTVRVPKGELPSFKLRGSGRVAPRGGE